MNVTVPARLWKQGQWTAFDETVSCEEAVRVHWHLSDPDFGEQTQGAHGASGVAHEGTLRLWAWPHGLEDLVLGHVLLEGVADLGSLGASGAPGTSGTSGFGAMTSGVMTARTVAASDPRGAMSGRQLVTQFLPQPLPQPVEHRFEVLLQRVIPGMSLPGTGIASVSAFSAASMHTLLAQPQAFLARMEGFMNLPGLWDATGCFHRAAAFALCQEGCGFASARVQPDLFVEDTGRHNCLDRLAGKAFRAGIDLRKQALFITARVTASLYVKARRAGFGVLVSRSAVSSEAVRAAHQEGVVLVGFCRHNEGRCTVFADGRAQAL